MSLKPKTVLIVDDDEGMRDTLTAILKREYRVLRVSSGEAALPILNREDVDLMLLDVRLPDGNGVEVFYEMPRAEWPADYHIFSRDKVGRGRCPGPWDAEIRADGPPTPVPQPAAAE